MLEILEHLPYYVNNLKYDLYLGRKSIKKHIKCNTYDTVLAIQATLPANLHVDMDSLRLYSSNDMVAIIAVIQFPPGNKQENI